jgi:hypothetical protein
VLLEALRSGLVPFFLRPGLFGSLP